MLTPAAVAALAAVLSLGGCGDRPGSPGEALLQERCGRCHSYDNALDKRKSAAGWERTVWAMRKRGARLSDEEARQLVRHLARERSP